jgi:TolB-like protein/Tfp pilus assembly protein PilF
MKRCPECRRDYYDDTLSFCLEDGTQLVYGVAADEPATAILSELAAAEGLAQETNFRSESATRPQIHTTDQTAVLPAGSIAETALRPTSSAEYLVNEVRNHGRGVAIGLAVFILAAVSLGYWFLKGSSPAGGSGPIASIAVLPFQNRSDDPDTDYLSDGLTESLIFRLSQLPGLKVSPTSSVIGYKGKDTDVSKIAGELGVDAVMTGRLMKRGDNLNITVELVDTRDNKSLWGEQYERKMSDLLATQREIAATIAQKLELKLAGNETKGITKQYTNSNEAYQLYLKGRYHFAKRTKDDILKSIDYYQQAIKLDPKFARAYVGIAEAYSTAPSYPYMSPAEGDPQAKAAVEKALELDPDLPEAHTVAGMIAATYDWDYPTAEREFNRSFEIDPNIAVTHYRYAWVYLSPLGRHDEAVAEMKRAMELEPLSIQQGANFAAVLMYARRFDEALEQAKKTYDLDPNHIGGQAWLAHTYNAKGMYAESLAITEKASRPDYTFYAQMGYSYAKLGRRPEAEATINKSKEAEKTKYVMSYWVAVTYAALGEKDAAFAELEKAYQAHDWFLQRLKTDPFMDPLRDDPRFNDLVRRIGLPQ